MACSSWRVSIGLLPNALAVAATLSGCATSQGVAPDVEIESLLLNEQDLPGDWVASPYGPTSDFGSAPLGGGLGPIRAVGLHYYHPIGAGSAGAYEDILLFRSESEAVEAIDYLVGTRFDDGPYAVWVDVRIDFPHASEASIQCTEGRADTMCRGIARYGRYVVDLKVDLVAFAADRGYQRVMSLEDFDAVIKRADDLMAPTLADPG